MISPFNDGLEMLLLRRDEPSHVALQQEGGRPFELQNIALQTRCARRYAAGVVLVSLRNARRNERSSPNAARRAIVGIVSFVVVRRRFAHVIRAAVMYFPIEMPTSS